MSNIFDKTATTLNADQAAPENSHPVESRQDSKDQIKQSEPPTGTDDKVKEATQELLRYGYIEEARKSALFRTAVTRESEINQVLEPLDLALKLDTFRGVVFLGVAITVTDHEDDAKAWSHPLVRRQRLTLEQSLLIALLRQAFVMHEQESGIGQSAARIAIDDLLPQYLTYFQDSGSDAKNESRLLNLLDQLKTYAIVSEVDKNQELTIRPMIAHLANPESLTALLNSLTMAAGTENSVVSAKDSGGSND